MCQYAFMVGRWERAHLHHSEGGRLKQMRLDARDRAFVQRDRLAALEALRPDDAHTPETEYDLVQEIPAA